MISTIALAIPISPAPAARSPMPKGATASSPSSPGAYPWYNARNAWRPAHIHYSLLGAGFAQRLITQMYFPGDPLFALDAIANAVPEAARQRLVAFFRSRNDRALLGPVLSLRLCAAPAPSNADGDIGMAVQTPWQTTGPFLHFGLPGTAPADLTGDSDLGARPDLIAPGHDYAVLRAKTGRDRTLGQRIELIGNVWDNRNAPIIDSLIEIWQANAAGRYAHPEMRATMPRSIPPSSASAAAPRTKTALSVSQLPPPSAPAAFPGPAIRCRHRTSRSPSWDRAS